MFGKLPNTFPKETDSRQSGYSMIEIMNIW